MKQIRQPLTAQAYTTLKKQIIELHLRPGETILIQSMAKRLGLSRTPVREALIRLKQEGMVEETESRKFRICSITLKSIKEIYEIREALEIMAIKRLSVTRTDAQINELRVLQEVLEKALAEKDYDTFFNSDLNFHNTIIHFYQNNTLDVMIQSLNDKVQRIRHLTANIPHRIEDTIKEHNEILTMIIKKDKAGAAKLMRMHLHNVTTGLERLFSNGTKSILGRIFSSFS